MKVKFRVYVPGKVDQVVEAATYEEAIDAFEQALWDAGVLADDERITDLVSGVGRHLADVLRDDGHVNIGEGSDVPSVAVVDEEPNVVPWEWFEVPADELDRFAEALGLDYVPSWASVKLPRDGGVLDDGWTVYYEVQSAPVRFAAPNGNEVTAEPNDVDAIRTLGEIVGVW